MLIEGDHGCDAGGLVEEIEEDFHEVVGMNWAARDVDNGDARFGSEIPSEVIGHTHAAGGVAFHGVDAAVSGAGAASDDGQGFGRQPVDPFAGGDGLPGDFVGAKSGPVSFRFDGFVGDRPFDDKDEFAEFVFPGVVPEFEEFVAVFIGEDGIVEMDFGEAGDGTEEDVFNTGLGGGGDGDGVAVTSEAGGDPEDVDFLECGGFLSFMAVGRCVCVGCGHKGNPFPERRSTVRYSHPLMIVGRSGALRKHFVTSIRTIFLGGGVLILVRLEGFGR